MELFPIILRCVWLGKIIRLIKNRNRKPSSGQKGKMLFCLLLFDFRGGLVYDREDETGLEHAMEKECAIVFILYGNVCSIPRIVEKVKSHEKLAIVHIDLILELSSF